MDTITLIESNKKDYYAVAYQGEYYYCKTKKELLEITDRCVNGMRLDNVAWKSPPEDYHRP